MRPRAKRLRPKPGNREIWRNSASRFRLLSCRNGTRRREKRWIKLTFLSEVHPLLAKRLNIDRYSWPGLERRNTDTTTAHEEDPFEVALEDVNKADKSARATRNGDLHTQNKRRKKDDKFGFGGKKRFSKSGDAASSADLRGFSARKMKGPGKGSQRLGKSRRAKKTWYPAAKVDIYSWPRSIASWQISANAMWRLMSAKTRLHQINPLAAMKVWLSLPHSTFRAVMSTPPWLYRQETPKSLTLLNAMSHASAIT